MVIGQESAQQHDESVNGALKVFMDCRCDMDYIRQQIPYVNYVREVKEAEVYVLVTSQNAGSGGNRFTFNYQGLKQFAGLNDTLVYSSSPDMTSAEVRENQVDMLKAGLIRYVARTNQIRNIDITHREGAGRAVDDLLDRWNNWVFEIRTSPRFDAEERYRTLSFSNSAQISKITPDIKLEVDFNQNFNRQRFIDEETDETYIRRSGSARILLVKSLGEHWSAGISGGLGKSTQSNYDFYHNIMPALEYNFYPYSEATHRQLRAMYTIGYRYSNYIDTSIYNLLQETRFSQELQVAYEVQEKWGSVNISVSGSNYLHDFSRNSVELDGFVRIRIIRGLSFSLNGEAAYINDRLNQRKGILTEAERLLRLKQQATSFQLGGSISINYTFGSIYNNVVNPRFGRY